MLMQKRELILSSLILIFVSGYCYAQVKPCFLKVEDSPALRGIRLGMTPDEISKIVRFDVKPLIDKRMLFIETKINLDRSSRNRIKNADKILANEKKIRISLRRQGTSPEIMDRWQKLNRKLIDESNPVSRRILSEFSKPYKEKKILYITLPELTKFDWIDTIANYSHANIENIWYFNFSFLDNRLYELKFFYKTNVYDTSTSEEMVLSLADLLNLPREVWTARTKASSPSGYVFCENFSVNASFNKGSGTIEIHDFESQLLIREKEIERVEAMYQDLKNRMEKNSEFKP